MATISKNHENGSHISAAGNEENGAANNSESLKNFNVPPVIDSDRMNAALAASANPRETLRKIREIANSARRDLKLGRSTDAFAAMNRIVMLTGGP